MKLGVGYGIAYPGSTRHGLAGSRQGQPCVGDHERLIGREGRVGEVTRWVASETVDMMGTLSAHMMTSQVQVEREWFRSVFG